MCGDRGHYALEGTTAIVTLDDGKANALSLPAAPADWTARASEARRGY
jgi:hypothetical protein